MKVAILGAGAMGSALTIPLSERGHEVRLWFTKYDLWIYDKIIKGEPHPRIKVRIPPSVKLYKPSDLGDAINGADYIIVAVSSEGVPTISQMLAEIGVQSNTPILIVSKGIEIVDGKAMTMSEIVRKYTGNDKTIFIAGPSLASELARKLYTHVVYASKYINIAINAAKSFETSYYRIDWTGDIIGAELSAALKNIYAIAYGIIEGYLKSKGIANNNLKAALLSTAVNEMARIVESCGGRRDTVYGLAGLGDLYVTSLGGRNSMFGQLIGEGLSVNEALKEMGRRGVGVVEGYKNAETIKSYLVDRGIRRDTAPLFYTIYSILYEGLDREELIKALG